MKFNRIMLFFQDMNKARILILLGIGVIAFASIGYVSIINSAKANKIGRLHEKNEIFSQKIQAQIKNIETKIPTNELTGLSNNLMVEKSLEQMNETENEKLANLERIVHIDLKGAPPKPDYFSSFIPFLKRLGATGILLEYEDTFPYEGQFADAKYGFAYTRENINMIKQLSKDNDLKLIPLVQTYGHLEWLLKLKKFAHLRETSEYPQVITPCLEESYTVLFGTH